MFKIKMTKAKYVLRFIVVLLGVILIYNIFKVLPYESQYFEKLGVNRVRYLYSDMIRDFGEPLEIRKVNEFDRVDAIYDEFIMRYPSESDDCFLLGIDIIGKKYRFGWRSIGVGSTRTEVERAYKHVKKSTDPICAYIDGKIFVEFQFDENDVVKEVSFFDYSHF